MNFLTDELFALLSDIVQYIKQTYLEDYSAVLQENLGQNEKKETNSFAKTLQVLVDNLGAIMLL